MEFSVSYGCIKALVATIILNPWARVYWLHRSSGHYDLWLGLAGGFVVHAQTNNSTDDADFASHKVSTAEVTTMPEDGGDDGFALAVHAPINVI